MTLLTVEEFPPQPTNDPTKVYLIRNVGLREGTHKFHRYPGKFIPHVPRWALRQYASKEKGLAVIDPFCGSGTTLVEAVLSAHRAFGFDIDPIARLISKVKTTPIDLPVLSTSCTEIRKFITQEREGNVLPTIPTLSHWFNKAAIRDLSLIREGIELFRGERDVYDFFLTVFIAIIRKASNADNQTIKTYVSHTHPKTPEPAKLLFLYTLDDYTQRLVEFGNLQRLMGGHAEILGAWDARAFMEQWKATGFPLVDLAITSPPYVKTVDYVYNQMAEYFWIGDLFGLSSQPEQNDHKELYIGTDRVNGAASKHTPKTHVPQIDEVIDRIAQLDKKNAYICGKYFLDMDLHFAEMARVLKPGSHYVLVVGDSVVSGETVPTHSSLPLYAERSGFALKRSFRYEIRNRHMRFPRAGRGGIVEHDWILDFRLES
jgi:DNA modification methylase